MALVLMSDKSYRRRIADLSTTGLNPHFQIERKCPDETNDSSRVLMCHAILNVDELISSRAHSNRSPQSELLVDKFKG